MSYLIVIDIYELSVTLNSPKNVELLLLEPPPLPIPSSCDELVK